VIRATRAGLASLVTTAAAVTFAPRAAPEVCGESLRDWEIVRGTLTDAGACGAYLGATDGGNGSFSYGDFLYRRPMHPPLDVEVTWRRVGPESGKSLELRLLGALILLRDDEYGLYVWNEASFEWRKLPGYKVHEEHRISAHQTATTLSFSVDGKPVDSWRLDMGGEHRIGVAAKGARGYRSWFSFRDFRASSPP
jgi:hypothetical protein